MIQAMTVDPAAVLLLALSYLLGSIPFAVLVSRAMGLPDPRSFGSGNPGATNVLRSGSRTGALLTLLGDSGKGALAVALALLLAERLGVGADARVPLAAWCGALAFFGHVFPVFLRFRGGKGVATFLGTMLAIEPRLGLIACAAWLAVAALLRYSSVASVCSALFALLAGWATGTEPTVLLPVALMTVVVVVRHKRNLAQVAAGTESRIGDKSKKKV
jgi:glycerol-3-phosphate acyltransferase PlsY